MALASPAELKGKSVVIVMPCYNDWESVLALIPLIDQSFLNLDVNLRIIIVDDASPEGCLSENFDLLNLQSVSQISCITLTRNMGSQRSIAVGVAYAAKNQQADYLIVADSDHEDKPEDMPRLLQACADSGDTKVIFAERSQRSESWLFKFHYFFYQIIFKLLTQTSISIGSFSATPWNKVRSMAHLAELWNHFPGAIIRAKIPYEQISCTRGIRKFGKSNMNLIPLITHAFSGFSIFSDVIAIRALIFSFVISAVIILVSFGLLFLRLFSDIPILGWTTTVLGLLSIIFIQFITTSILMLFLVCVIRMLPPLIPITEFEKYILQIRELFSRDKETT